MLPLLPRLLAPLLPLSVALGLTACSTQRTLEIDSNPTGARIWVNGVEQASTTPVTVPFVHYGRFDVRVEKEGHVSQQIELVLDTPFEERPFIDLSQELFVPRKHYRRVVTLEPLDRTPDRAAADQALSRARTFRRDALRSVEEGQATHRALPPIAEPPLPPLPEVPGLTPVPDVPGGAVAGSNEP